MTTLDATNGEGLRAALGRLPVIGPAGRRARRAWDLARPFRRPKYLPGTPRVSAGDVFDAYLPPNPTTLAEAAMSDEAMSFVADLIQKLEPTQRLRGQLFYYRWGQGKFGRYWRYADLLTLLWAAATLARPANYLEIGMHRGRSASVVAALCPACDVYGFDLWIPGYDSMEVPGPEFVREQLQAVGHQGTLTLTSGDSHRTVPAFLREHPDLYFDLMNVDGDHTMVGAADDLANVLPRLKVGGIVLFDDLCMNPGLTRVWNKVVRDDSRYVTREFTETGFGVAVAVRIGDQGRFI